MDSVILENLPIFVAKLSPVKDLRGEIIDLQWQYVNEYAARLIGKPANELVGSRIAETAGAAIRRSQALEAAIQTIKTGKAIEKIVDNSQSKMMNIFKLSILPCGGGALLCGIDITDLAKESSEKGEHLAVFRSAVDMAVYPITLGLADGSIVYSNKAAQELLGYTADELKAYGWINIVHPDDVHLDISLGAKFARGEISQDITDRRLITRAGKEVLVSSAVSRAHSDYLQQDFYIAHAIPIDEERAIRKELQDALEKAEDGARLKTEFLANISHEIRTPLNAVLGMAQLLARSGLSEEQLEQCEEIQFAGRSLLTLLNDILDLSKIESGRVALSKMTGNLRTKLSGLVAFHQKDAAAKGLSIKLFVDPDFPERLDFDPLRVKQCVDHLIDNAIKFSGSGEIRIVLSCEPAEEGTQKIVLHVIDQGSGIHADKLETIFSSFTQEDGTRTRTHEGAGLGLAITRKLSQIMGGDVTVKSRTGSGSIFTFTFLANRPDTVTKTPAASYGKPLDKRALVVDDNEMNRSAAKLLLSARGYACEEATDGLEALDQLMAEPFDLVLMDIHMPILDGFSAIRQLRDADGPNKDTIVLATTTDILRGDSRRFLAFGFNGYLARPLNPRSLDKVIEGLTSGDFETQERRANS